MDIKETIQEVTQEEVTRKQEEVTRLLNACRPLDKAGNCELTEIIKAFAELTDMQGQLINQLIALGQAMADALTGTTPSNLN